MHKGIRLTLAVVAGVVCAFALIATIEAVGHAVYPPPRGVDFSKAEEARRALAGLPAGALWLVIAAWTSGSFGGGVVAALIARPSPRLVAGVVGVFVLVATIANLILLPHPTWVSIAGVAGVVAGAWAAGRLVVPSAAS
jgi:hypothetical protein